MNCTYFHSQFILCFDDIPSNDQEICNNDDKIQQEEWKDDNCSEKIQKCRNFMIDHVNDPIVKVQNLSHQYKKVSWDIK